MNSINPTQHQLGGSGVAVNAIGLGGMPLSIDGRPDEAQAYQVIETFVQGGGNFIDTANVYCLDDTEIGHNEKLMYKVLKSLGLEEKVVVATKGGLTYLQGRWKVNGRPLSLRTACEQSLKDLNAEAIFLYQLHAVDPKVPLAESLGELIRLEDEGKIRHIGLSNVRMDQVKYALEHTFITSVQNRCNALFKKDLHNGLIDFCHTKHISYIPYSPVGGHASHTRLRDQHVLKRLSEKYNESSYCIALSWLLQLGEHVIPIPGATRTESVTDSARALTIRLDPEDIAEINQIADES